MMPYSAQAEARDKVANTAEVLNFLTDSLCWLQAGEGIELSADGVAGLFLILSGCRDTLQNAAATWSEQ